jgi:hypothetical protein
VTLITWTIVEPGVYLIAACLPTLRPLLLHIFRRLPTSVKSTERSNNSNTTKGSHPLSKGTIGAGSHVGFRQLEGASADNMLDDTTLSGTRTTWVSTNHRSIGDEGSAIPLGTISCRGDIRITRSVRIREEV